VEDSATLFNCGTGASATFSRVDAIVVDEEYGEHGRLGGGVGGVEWEGEFVRHSTLRHVLPIITT
jgi:hypothetical protein